MTENQTKYLRAVFQGIFEATELIGFCKDHYRIVHDNLTRGLFKDEIITHLLSWYERNVMDDFKQLGEQLIISVKQKINSILTDYKDDELSKFCDHNYDELFDEVAGITREEIVDVLRDHYWEHPDQFHELEERLDTSPKEIFKHWFFLDRNKLRNEFLHFVDNNDEYKFFVFLYDSRIENKCTDIPDMLRTWYIDYYFKKRPHVVKNKFLAAIDLSLESEDVERDWRNTFKKNFEIDHNDEEFISTFMKSNLIKKHLFVYQSLNDCKTNHKLKNYLSLWKKFDFRSPFFLILSFSPDDFVSLSSVEPNHFYCGSKYHDLITRNHLIDFYTRCKRFEPFPYKEEYFIKAGESLTFKDAVEKLK